MTSYPLTPQTERILVCLGPGASSAGLINAAWKMAADLKAKWFVLYVEDPRTLLLPEDARNRVFDNLRLAEQLGAETFTLTGRHIAEEIITFAGQRKITKIVVGKPGGSFWKRFLLKSPVDKLVRMSGRRMFTSSAGNRRNQESQPMRFDPRGSNCPTMERASWFLYWLPCSVF